MIAHSADKLQMLICLASLMHDGGFKSTKRVGKIMHLF